jgi:sulfane dehydrogenase subunit SoxC
MRKNMNTFERARRRFLTEGAMLAGLAVGAGSTARAQMPTGPIRGPYVPNARKDLDVRPRDLNAYGERSRFVNSIRLADGGNSEFGGSSNVMTPLQDSIGIITPSSLHFASSHGYYPPDINPDEYRLMIHGMVDRPLVFTLDELKRLPSISRVMFIECQANKPTPLKPNVQLSHGRTACSEWTGVALSLLLKEAGVQKGATWVIAEGDDAGKHTKSLPLTKAMHDILVAYGQNGEPVRPHQGYPVRLVVPGFEGITHVKWLRRLKVVNQPHLAPQERFGFELGPKSVITFPSGEQRLPTRGFYEISGLAWSGGGAIKTVEVSTDGGRTWKEAELKQPPLPIAHTRFALGWVWNGEETVLMSRCTDELGQYQPTVAEFAKYRKKTPAEILESGGGGGHFNVIQPWRIAADGRVYNAIA